MDTVHITLLDQYVIDKVREIRLDKGISQRELADLLELSSGFIGMVESPKRRAKYNIGHLNELAKALECSPRDFLPDAPLP